MSFGEQEIEKKSSNRREEICRVLARIPLQKYSTKIKAESTTSKGLYSMDFGEVVQQRKCMHFEVGWHRNRGTLIAGIYVQLTHNLWHEFLDSSYSIKCCDSRTVVRISCTEIEELTWGLFKRIFGSFSEISLWCFCCTYFHCKKRISLSSKNNKNPLSHWFSPCGFFQGQC